MRKTRFCLVTALVMLVWPAGAQIIGGSNISLTQYPGPDCTRPVPPVQPVATAGDQADPSAYNFKVRKYNSDVTGYNSAIKAFNDCMRIYVENGNADMQRIKQRLDQAVAEANAH
jgi:hypothetical protein